MAKGKAKRPSMGDALAKMGELNAARPAVESGNVVEREGGIRVQLPAGMTQEDAEAAAEEIHAKKRAYQQRQDEATARGEDPFSVLTRGPVEADPVEVEPDTAPEPASAPAVIVSAPATETMRPALKDGTPTAYKRESVAPRARSHVEKERRAQQTRPASVPKGYNVRPPRIEKPHQSIYADPAVFRVIRQIAAAEDVKPQDLYREALRALLKKRGFDFDKLDRGEA